MPTAETPYALLNDPHAVLWYEEGVGIWYVPDTNYKWDLYVAWLALGNTPLPAIF